MRKALLGLGEKGFQIGGIGVGIDLEASIRGRDMMLAIIGVLSVCY